MNDLDKLAADVAALDPRLRVARDNPDCFLCGKVCGPRAVVYVESGASPQLAAHSRCVNNMQAVELMARYWQAVRAAIQGEGETPNPCAPVVHGRFE